ncbi:hypothetical protein AWV80_31955 [Cupriavidus sp. UYMU48A]|nr:hypothetical protein AWV80_31955 [Cupriavidus sp. UYMU48A]
MINGQWQQVTGLACLQSDGSWQLVDGSGGGYYTTPYYYDDGYPWYWRLWPLAMARRSSSWTAITTCIRCTACTSARAAAGAAAVTVPCDPGFRGGVGSGVGRGMGGGMGGARGGGFHGGGIADRRPH